MKIGLTLLGIYFFISGLVGLPGYFVEYPSEIKHLRWVNFSQSVIVLLSGFTLLFVAHRLKQASNLASENQSIPLMIVVKLMGLFFMIDTSSKVANALISQITSSFDTFILLNIFVPPFLQFLAGLILFLYSQIFVDRFLSEK